MEKWQEKRAKVHETRSKAMLDVINWAEVTEKELTTGEPSNTADLAKAPLLNVIIMEEGSGKFYDKSGDISHSHDDRQMDKVSDKESENTVPVTDEILLNQNLYPNKIQTDRNVNVNVQLEAEVENTEMEVVSIHFTKKGYKENLEPVLDTEEDTMMADVTNNTDSIDGNNTNIMEYEKIETFQKTHQNLTEDGFTIVSKKKKKN
ncbi:5182_t:CDS:2 [Racocetra fulgida]|uniref:5182_t:CDS:1 n=1 Tax=Racocetra fulgida TaxID=60492 RepID=A0A9N9FIC1_9GLOM|nr:5182_t:CDS:2 [Racocetra fulgida]